MSDNKYGSYYNEKYYLSGCGKDYNDRTYWASVFQKVAQNIVELYRPVTYLDVGCAYGYLVEALHDLGVKAYGVDVSSYAISKVREDIRPYCFVANVAEGLPAELPSQFDCISAIEVIEHLYEEDEIPFLQALCGRTQHIVFSSTPDDFDEKSHFNVQQQEHWAKRFAQQGFLRDFQVDLSFIAPQAVAFVKSKKETLRLIEDYERANRVQRQQSEKEISAIIKNKDNYIGGLTTQQLQERREWEIQTEQQRVIIKDILDSVYEKIGKEHQKVILAKNREAELKNDYNRLNIDLANTRNHEQQLQQTHDQIVNSTFWKFTWPGRVVVSKVKKFFHPTKGQPLGNATQLSLSQTSEATDVPIAMKQEEKMLSVRELLRAHFQEIVPIEAMYSEEDTKRLNLVTDTISSHSLLGGVATALIVATEFANKMQIPLRIITLTDEVEPTNYENILRLNGVPYPDKVTFFSHYYREDGSPNRRLDVGKEDIFFATSWWSAKSIKDITIREDFYYIIQEVETFFYEHGDRHLMCSEIMQDKNIHFIVNSKFLWDYFEENQKNITENGVYFEPAFSKTLYHPCLFRKKEKYRLFFYARPNNPRNLFGFGILMLDTAIQKGIIDTTEWEICFAGQDYPDFTFCDGTKPLSMGQMSWQEYSEFVADTDLALSLMYTPHPSYPPYDVAVSGGVVLTNECANKTTFEYCDNVIVAPLNRDAFLEKMKQAIALAKDMQMRHKNYETMTIPREWTPTLQDTLKKMEEWS